MGKFDDFYNTKEWKMLRMQKYIDADGFCERCMKSGIVRRGKEVHHIVPLDKDWSRRLDYNNLILLCPECHNEIHERVSPLQIFEKEWEKI